MPIKVGIMGYGTIGKRVADAVMLQKDMELAGVMAHSYNFKIDAAYSKGLPIYALEDKKPFSDHGIEIAGMKEDLLKDVDVMVDCSPKPLGKQHRDELYKPKNIKAIFQGGEKPDVGEVSFVAQGNYKDAVGKDFVRVVSCNTTGLTRTLNALNKGIGVEVARATLIRRATDPAEIRAGPVNAIVPSLELPSHHGPDVRTVLYDLQIYTTAVIVPTTLMHMHSLNVRLKKNAAIDDVLDIFRRTTRIRIINADTKIYSTAQIMEYAKDLGHRRGDMMDICLWDKGIGMHEDELFLMQAVHQESDVIPENIDAIRAVMGEKDHLKSIRLTNKSLGLSNPEKFDY